MTKIETIKTAGIALRSVMETMLPEHRVLKMHTNDTSRPYIEFAGFIDEVNSEAIQTVLNSSTITIKQFTYADGNTRIFYTLTAPQTDTYADFTFACDQLSKEANEAIQSPTFVTDYLGKKGKFNELAKLMKDIAPDKRGDAGKLLNQLKTALSAIAIASESKDQGPGTRDHIDTTVPGISPNVGHLHLISEAIEEVDAIFARLGFIRRRYPEIESDWYYAEGLNIPKDHPARDEQETFYFSESVVLTAHTSNGQLREMELLKGNLPIKMINIGRTYRRQASNTHSPMFHQFEGLVVDKGINMTHLVGVSNYFAKNYFGPDREIRLRPHHFQFTEPSFEVDINCHICKGKGEIDGHKCKVCKSGWLELGGAGMVHPNVLRNGGIDPEVYSGFAFGWGIERIIMMKHQVTDNLRLLYTDDLRFLSQS